MKQLERKISEDLFCEVTRSAYCDWLKEHGKHEQAKIQKRILHFLKNKVNTMGKTLVIMKDGKQYTIGIHSYDLTYDPKRPFMGLTMFDRIIAKNKRLEASRKLPVRG